MKPRKLYGIACIRFNLLMNYVQYSKVIYLTVCARIGARTDCNEVKVTARTVIYLHQWTKTNNIHCPKQNAIIIVLLNSTLLYSPLIYEGFTELPLIEATCTILLGIHENCIHSRSELQKEC